MSITKVTTGTNCRGGHLNLRRGDLRWEMAYNPAASKIAGTLDSKPIAII